MHPNRKITLQVSNAENNIFVNLANLFKVGFKTDVGKFQVLHPIYKK